MIGFVHDAIVDVILAPQATADDPELRVYVDPEAAPIDAAPQEFDVVDGVTRPVGWEIGGAVEFAHTVMVGLDVQHGDRAVARSLRDRILTAVVLRSLRGRDELEQLVDADNGQTIEGITLAIDYRPFGASDTNESATITYTVTTRIGG